MPHAEYEVYSPRSKATTSRSGSRRRALVAALIPAASPPTIASRSAMVGKSPRWPRRLAFVPELPEVEITARRLDAALRGAEIESTLAPGINALKTFDPPLQAIDGRAVTGVRRIGKHLVVDVAGDLHVLVHLMSAGRLQLFDKRAGLRDRPSGRLVPIPAGRELRLREFATKRAAGVRVRRAGGVEEEEHVATLGREAGPDPPQDLRELLD